MPFCSVAFQILNSVIFQLWHHFLLPEIGLQFFNKYDREAEG